MNFDFLFTAAQVKSLFIEFGKYKLLIIWCIDLGMSFSVSSWWAQGPQLPGATGTKGFKGHLFGEFNSLGKTNLFILMIQAFSLGK